MCAGHRAAAEPATKQKSSRASVYTSDEGRAEQGAQKDSHTLPHSQLFASGSTCPPQSIQRPPWWLPSLSRHVHEQRGPPLLPGPVREPVQGPRGPPALSPLVPRRPAHHAHRLPASLMGQRAAPGPVERGEGPALQPGLRLFPWPRAFPAAKDACLPGALSSVTALRVSFFDLKWSCNRPPRATVPREKSILPRPLH